MRLTFVQKRNGRTLEEVVRDVEELTIAICVSVGWAIDDPEIVTLTLDDGQYNFDNAHEECRKCDGEGPLGDDGHCSHCQSIWKS